ncbi:kinase-like domain-containing protein [Catenaria anguillulae PL171]|uniref:Kinase-like domain-containing protein n=1 Tax=Catenaria anguillulae PL171 TaxID=765915 RepID=A0A1Y2H892_9FUNG|nr:kinase-like domain-containing protein [Catenaria anguillulae PL171]
MTNHKHFELVHIIGTHGVLKAYHFGKIIGSGSFGTVFEVEHLATGEMFACKVIDQSAPDFDPVAYNEEICAMQTFDHENIMGFREEISTTYCDKGNYSFIFTELLDGGRLHDRIADEGALSEDECREFVRQLISGVSHMHEHGLAHRDLKPENIMLTQGNEPNMERIALIDFGFAIPRLEPIAFACGTQPYMAPELLDPQMLDGVDHRLADAWAVGATVYEMATGLLPLGNCWDKQAGDWETGKATKARIMATMLNLRSAPNLKSFSQEGRDLIACLLENDPRKRMTVSEARDHPWLNVPTSHTDQLATSARKSGPTASDILKTISLHSAEVQGTLVANEMAKLKATIDAGRKVDMEHCYCALCDALENPMYSAVADKIKFAFGEKLGVDTTRVVTAVSAPVPAPPLAKMSWNKQPATIKQLLTSRAFEVNGRLVLEGGDARESRKRKREGMDAGTVEGQGHGIGELETEHRDAKGSVKLGLAKKPKRARKPK